MRKIGAGGEIYDDNYMNKSLGESYGIDIEKELTSLLSEELAKSIDAQIIKNLFSKKTQRVGKIRNILKSLG